jgi:hypothetical protein
MEHVNQFITNFTFSTDNQYIGIELTCVRNPFFPICTVEGNNLRKCRLGYYLTDMDSYKNCHCKMTQFR